MSHYLVTGGSGFFGSILKCRLIREGHTCVNIDLEPDEDVLPGLSSIRGDLRDAALMQRVFAENVFDAIFHVAAQMAHGMWMDERLLWSSNVDATKQLAGLARAHGVKPFVFVSTNCLWAADPGYALSENDEPAPIEIYGLSKLQAEKELTAFADDLHVVIIRTPTIMDSNRLGLLAILYEFIDDSKTVWVVGSGGSRYQFVCAEDMAAACILGAQYGRSGTFHVGSDNVKTMREVYESVIARSGSKSRVRSLPKGPAIAAMIVAHKLKISPLGPYHYKMIAENFSFDTTLAKQELGWSPTLTNEEMMLRAYEYYAANRKEIAARTGVSAHKRAAGMGVIRLLKWLS